jgi:hypothetical protein
MRNLPTALAAVAVLSSLLVACVLAAANDAEEVRNVVAAFATTWNRHDLDAFGKLFAPDADFVNVAGVMWTGRQSIQAQHAYIHGVIPADSPGFGEEDRRYYGIFKSSSSNQQKPLILGTLRQPHPVRRSRPSCPPQLSRWPQTRGFLP